MLLEDLVTHLCEELEKNHDRAFFTPEYIYATLDVQGQSNMHLANPLNRDPNVFYFRPRMTALSGTELLHGTYLLFDYCAHDESMHLIDYPSLGDLEQAIIGPLVSRTHSRPAQLRLSRGYQTLRSVLSGCVHTAYATLLETGPSK
jgi:hypothetical protein